MLGFFSTEDSNSRSSISFCKSAYESGDFWLVFLVLSVILASCGLVFCVFDDEQQKQPEFTCV